MSLYSINNKKLNFIKEDKFKLEKEIQTICENNLEELFGLEFVKSEATIQNFRLDTIAFSKDSKSFVIIEYKRDKNYSVVDQGLSYLNVMLNNKSEFILEYNESKNKALKREDIDWSQSKVIFVSPAFTPYQIQSINFQDLPIELWEIKNFINNCISINQINPNKSAESFKTISKNSSNVQKISKEIKTYTEKESLQIANETVKEIYETLKQKILTLGSEIKIKTLKQYIAFVAKTNFCDFVVNQSSLNLFLNLKKGILKDDTRLAEDVSGKGHWGNGDYRIKLTDTTDLDYVLYLIKQSYEVNSNETPHSKMWAKRKSKT